MNKKTSVLALLAGCVLAVVVGYVFLADEDVSAVSDGVAVAPKPMPVAAPLPKPLEVPVPQPVMAAPKPEPVMVAAPVEAMPEPVMAVAPVEAMPEPVMAAAPVAAMPEPKLAEARPESKPLAKPRPLAAARPALDSAAPAPAQDAVAGQVPFTTGQIAYNTPDSLKLDEETLVQLIVSHSKDVETLKSRLSAEAGGSRQGAEGINTSRSMKAVLSGSGFEITPLSEERQRVFNQGAALDTSWQWRVKALEGGVHRLNLSLSAVLAEDGVEEVFTVETFSREIVVNVSARQRAEQFVSANWEWLWSAILVPIFGFGWKRLTGRKDED